MKLLESEKVRARSIEEGAEVANPEAAERAADDVPSELKSYNESSAESFRSCSLL